MPVPLVSLLHLDAVCGELGRVCKLGLARYTRRMKRKALTNTQWKRLQPLLPPQKPKTARPALDPRRLITGILWSLRTGAPWRDLPKRYGCWSTVASRFYRWQKARLWQRLFEAVQQQADAEGKINGEVHYLDGTIVRAHQHAAGSSRGAEAEA